MTGRETPQEDEWGPDETPYDSDVEQSTQDDDSE